MDREEQADVARQHACLTEHAACLRAARQFREVAVETVETADTLVASGCR